MNKLGFAVVGCGRMGKRRARAIVNNPNGKLLCVADKNPRQAKLLANELECDFQQDYHKAIKRDDVAAVVICVPNKYHPTITVESLERGKHVFCEKPLAITPKEARLMVETASREGLYLKAGSNVRWFRNVQKAKEMFDNHKIGRPLFARGWIGHDGWNLNPDSWFTKPELIGGGTMLDNGCHLIDLVRWFMGEIKDCVGYCARRFHNLSVSLEDNAVGVLVGMNGEPIMIQSSWTDWNGYFYLEIYGTHGLLQIENRGNEAKTTFKSKKGETQVFDYSSQPKDSFQREIDDFVSSVLNRKQPLPSGCDGMKVVEIINALYKPSNLGIADRFE